MLLFIRLHFSANEDIYIKLLNRSIITSCCCCCCCLFVVVVVVVYLFLSDEKIQEFVAKLSEILRNSEYESLHEVGKNTKGKKMTNVDLCLDYWAHASRVSYF